MSAFSSKSNQQKLTLMKPHFTEDDAKILFKSCSKKARTNAKEKTKHFKKKSYIERLIITVWEKDKLIGKIIAHENAQTSITAAKVLLEEQHPSPNVSSSSDPDPTPKIKTTATPTPVPVPIPPSSPTSQTKTPTAPITPAANTTSNPTATTTPPTHTTASKYIDDITLEFKVDLDKGIGCKITHHKVIHSKYHGYIGKVAPLPGQAAIAGVEVGMHVRKINSLDCMDKDIGWVLQTIKTAKKSNEGKFDIFFNLCSRSRPRPLTFFSQTIFSFYLPIYKCIVRFFFTFTGLILFLSHETNELTKIEPPKEEPKEKTNDRRTRLMNEWIDAQGLEVWKQKSWLERFHLLVNNVSVSECQRLLKDAPKKIKKKLKEKIGVEKFKTMTPQERLLKLHLKEKHAKALVKEVPKQHRHPVIHDLGQTEWNTFDPKKQMEIMRKGKRFKM